MSVLSRMRAAAVALLALATIATTRDARADFFEFTAVGSVSNLGPPGSFVVGNGTNLITITTPGGTVITLTGNSSNDPTFHEDGTPPGTDIVFANITATTTPATPLEAVAFDFDFTLNITDYADELVGGPPLGSGSIHIVGHLGGSVGPGRKVNLSTLTNYGTVPNPGILVAHDTTGYLITLNNYVPPGTSSAGAFGAHVLAIPVPEPASMLMVGVGVVLVGLWGARRRRALLRALREPLAVLPSTPYRSGS